MKTNKKVIYIFAVIILIIFSGCSNLLPKQITLDSQAKALLEKYNLHPQKKLPTISTILLDKQYPDLTYFDTMNKASSDIGLELIKYKGKQVKLLRYLLKEPTQASIKGKLYAYFLFDGSNIVGAFIAPSEYEPNYKSINYYSDAQAIPSIFSIKDRSSLIPANLKADKLNFDGATKIIIFGGQQTYETTITQPAELQTYISLLNKAIPHRGSFKASSDNKSYNIVVTMPDGPSVNLYFATGEPVQMVAYLFEGWYYEMPKELAVKIKEKLGEQ